MATYLNKLENKVTDPSSVRKVLSYGEKLAKIGPVYLEIFDDIRQFFGHVVPDVHKSVLSTQKLQDRISRNFHMI